MPVPVPVPLLRLAPVVRQSQSHASHAMDSLEFLSSWTMVSSSGEFAGVSTKHRQSLNGMAVAGVVVCVVVPGS